MKIVSWRAVDPKRASFFDPIDVCVHVKQLLSHWIRGLVKPKSNQFRKQSVSQIAIFLRLPCKSLQQHGVDFRFYEEYRGRYTYRSISSFSPIVLLFYYGMHHAMRFGFWVCFNFQTKNIGYLLFRKQLQTLVGQSSSSIMLSSSNS